MQRDFKIGIEQAKDTAMAVLLILLILMLFLGRERQFLIPAMIVLVLAMTWPAVFKPLAKVWFGLSHVLGTVASKVLLTVVFFLLATPVGLFRRVYGADAMKRKAWRRGDVSAFIERRQTYDAKDLEKPY